MKKNRITIKLTFRNITEALEELTTRLKLKISRSFEILSHPTPDSASLAQDTCLELNHPQHQVKLNEPNERHSSPQAFEANLSPQNSSPNIFIENYNLEPCQCNDFQEREHLSDNMQDCICISMNESPEGNEAVGLFSREDSVSQRDLEECGCSSVPHLMFTEKSVQTETPEVNKEAFKSDLQK